MITSGERWLDTSGSPVEAHGGSIWQDKDTKLYHWVGETRKGAPPQRNEGVGLYSSPDLVAWTDHGSKEIAPRPTTPGVPVISPVTN